jgi:hypothetical protein
MNYSLSLNNLVGFALSYANPAPIQHIFVKPSINLLNRNNMKSLVEAADVFQKLGDLLNPEGYTLQLFDTIGLTHQLAAPKTVFFFLFELSPIAMGINSISARRIESTGSFSLPETFDDLLSIYFLTDPSDPYVVTNTYLLSADCTLTQIQPLQMCLS